MCAGHLAPARQMGRKCQASERCPGTSGGGGSGRAGGVGSGSGEPESPQHPLTHDLTPRRSRKLFQVGAGAFALKDDFLTVNSQIKSLFGLLQLPSRAVLRHLDSDRTILSPSSH